MATSTAATTTTARHARSVPVLAPTGTESLAPAAIPAWERRHDAPDAPLADVIPLRRPTSHASRRPTRATYWRRRATVLAGLGMLVAAILAIGGLGRADAGPTRPAGAAVVVEPGQTLWDIAVANAADGQDPRDLVQQIRELNGLTSSSLPAWSVVLLPAG